MNERDEALEPALTKADRRILAAIPEYGGRTSGARREVHEVVTVWAIAEAIDTLDLVDLDQTLGGLAQLGYIQRSTSLSRKRPVYWRTRKGDEALAGSSHRSGEIGR